MNKGKIIRRTGRVLGSVIELNLITVGTVIGGIAILAGKKRFGKDIRKKSKEIGRFAGRAAKISTHVVGTIMEAASSEGISLAKTIGKRAVKTKVKIYGDPSVFYDKDKIVKADFKEL